MRSLRLTTIAVWVFIVVCFVVPLALIVWRGLTGLQAGAFADVGRVVGATLGQATVSTLVAVAAALPVAWATTVVPGRLRRWVLVWVAVPFIVPTPVAAAMAIAVCGPQRWCGQLLGVEVAAGYWFVVVVHAWYNAGIVVRVVGQAWQRIGARYSAAAATLAAPPLRRFLDLELPLLWPSIASSAAMVLVYCIGSFGVIVLLGGGRMVSLEVEIWRQTVQFLRLDSATVLAVVQLLLTVGLFVLAERTGGVYRLAPSTAQSLAVPRRVRWLAVALLVCTLVVCVVPFATLVPRALGYSDVATALRTLTTPVRGSGITIAPLATIERSLGIAALVTVVTVVVGWVASAPGSPLRRLVVLPMGVSAITLSLGHVLWFGALGWLASGWVLVAVHTVLALPLVARQIQLARDRMPASYSHAAATLGAPPWRRLWQVELPMLRRPLLAAALLGSAVSLGDYAAALVLARPDTTTAPVAIARFLMRPGALNYATSAALSLVFVCCCIGVMLVVQWLDRDDA